MIGDYPANKVCLGKQLGTDMKNLKDRCKLITVGDVGMILPRDILTKSLENASISWWGIIKENVSPPRRLMRVMRGG